MVRTKTLRQLVELIRDSGWQSESPSLSKINLPYSHLKPLSIAAERELYEVESAHLISQEEWEILEAAKKLSCKPVRKIVDDRENSENPGQSIPAPTGMMTLGGRGEIRKVCEAVIRWRKAAGIE